MAVIVMLSQTMLSSHETSLSTIMSPPSEPVSLLKASFNDQQHFTLQLKHLVCLNITEINFVYVHACGTAVVQNYYYIIICRNNEKSYGNNGLQYLEQEKRIIIA